MSQQLRIFAVLEEYLGSVLSTHRRAHNYLCNTSSSGTNGLSIPCADTTQAHGYTYNTHKT